MDLLAASVTAMPKPRSHRANVGTGALRRAESSITSRPACLAKSAYEIVGVLVGCDRSHRRDAEHSKSG